MKTIGLLGGMSWQSTSSYYSIINQEINKTLGGLHSAKIVLYSVNFSEIEKLQRDGDWETAATILTDAAKSIEAGGADFILICTNTMHKVADEISKNINIPLLHIGDATGIRLQADGIHKVALLGTSFTMEQNFYKNRIQSDFGIEVLTPEKQERDEIHRVIFEELCMGKFVNSSRDSYLEIISSLSKKGAQAVILGCTEISLLVKQEDTPVSLYDTTQIHAEEAVKRALK